MKLGFVVFSLIALPIKFYDTLVLVMGMIICVLGLRRQMKGIQFTKVFFSTAVIRDFGAGLIYLILMLGVKKPLRVFCLPMSLYFALGFAEFVNIEKIYFFQKIEKINNILTYLRTNSANLKTAKLLMEFFLIFYSLLLLFFGGNIFTPISLFNFMRIRMLNPNYKNVMTTFMTDIYGRLVGSSNPIFRVLGKVWGYLMKFLL